MSQEARVYLYHCSFKEKDAAKKTGARWDGIQKKWYVPEDKLDQLEMFNQWKPNGRMYLNCPFSDKNRVKKLGAKWDGQCKKWFIFPSKNTSETDFEEWLPSQSSSNSINMASSPQKNASLEDSPIKRPKTVRTPTKIATPKKASVSSAKKTIGKKRQNNSDVNSVSVSVSKKFKTDSYESLPRITNSLSVAQLTCELLNRDPSVKGMSNKNKQWFLDRLGVGSIWTSSPDAAGTDLTMVPKVSSSMTIAQLSHELLTRNPTQTGISGKNKTWFLELLGEGSVCTTGASDVSAYADKKVASKNETPDSLSKSTPHTKATKEAKPKVAKKETKAKAEKPIERKEKASATKEKNISAKKAEKKALAPKKKKDAPAKAPHLSSSTKPVVKVTSLQRAQVVKKVKATKEKVKIPSVDVLQKEQAKEHCSAPDPVDVTSLQCAQVVKKEKATKEKVKIPSVAALQNQQAKDHCSAPDPVASTSTSKVTLGGDKNDVPKVSKSMTIAQLKEECKVRDTALKGFSNKNKTWLLDYLVEGSELEGSKAWHTKNIHDKHTHKFLCHHHPLADSSEITMFKLYGTRTPNKRIHDARCDIGHRYLCDGSAYRSCALCDFDICQKCLEIESLPSPKKEEVLKQKVNKIIEEHEAQRMKLIKEDEAQRMKLRQEWEQRHEEEKRRREEEYKDYLRKLAPSIKNPTAKHLNSKKKFKYVVWTSYRNHGTKYDDRWHSYYGPPEKEFNSSYDTLEEANRRVEYVFYFKNPWGEERDEMNADTESIHPPEGIRYMSCEQPDNKMWTVSVVQSNDFDISSSIMVPDKKHLNREDKLKYTVWSSDGYGNDGWHSYHGPPEKEFNSSYDTLEEANLRVAYVFYCKNPWGLGKDEMNEADTDYIRKQGMRYMSCEPDDSGIWTVSVVPSLAFDYINDDDE